MAGWSYDSDTGFAVEPLPAFEGPDVPGATTVPMPAGLVAPRFGGLAWAEGDPDAALLAAQARARERVRAACLARIVSGFVCEALGSPHTYPCELADQANLSGSVQEATLELGAAGWVTRFWCADGSGSWARRPHTSAQIIGVGRAAKRHVSEAQEAYEAALAQIAAAVSVEHADSIGADI